LNLSPFCEIVKAFAENSSSNQQASSKKCKIAKQRSQSLAPLGILQPNSAVVRGKNDIAVEFTHPRLLPYTVSVIF
jgi:hypothetical protein